GDETGGVAARAVGSLTDEKVLRHAQIAAGEAVLAKRLLKRGRVQVPLRRAERNVASVVRERDLAGKNVAVTENSVELGHAFHTGIENIAVSRWESGGDCQVGREPIAPGETTAGASFRPVEVEAVEVVAAGVKADVGEQEVRVGKAHEVA